MGSQAESALTVSGRIRSTRRLLGLSIGVAVLLGGQTPPILSRVIAIYVFSQMSLSTAVAVCDAFPVHVLGTRPPSKRRRYS